MVWNRALWKFVIDQFLPVLKGSVTTVGSAGEVLLAQGVPPEACTPGSVLGACLNDALSAFSPYTTYACVHGARHVAVPVKQEDRRVVTLVYSSSEEVPAGHLSVVLGLSVVLAQVCFQKEETRVIEQLRHRSVFLPTVLSAATVENMCRNAVSYCMHAFGLANCVVVLEDGRYRYNNMSTLEPVVSVVEQRLLKHAREMKVSFVVRDAAQDLLTADIPNIQVMKGSLAVFPLVCERVFGGALVVSFVDALDADVLSALAEQFALALVIVRRFAHAQDRAQCDPLTGLMNRSALVEALSGELPAAQKENVPTSLAIVDLDDFKQYNDTYGHLKGDALLQGLAQVMNEVIPHVYRYGGEEFVLLFPRMAQQAAAEHTSRVLEQCRAKLGVTVSIGVVTCQNSSLGAYELMNEADKALYRAKNTGKNRVCHSLVVDKHLGVIQVEEANSLGKY